MILLLEKWTPPSLPFISFLICITFILNVFLVLIFFRYNLNKKKKDRFIINHRRPKEKRIVSRKRIFLREILIG